MKALTKLFIAALAASTLAGCANTTMSGTHYVREETRRPQAVSMAEVVQVIPVTIEDRKSGMTGGLIGGLLGGVVGSKFGAGTGQTVATAVGAIGGAAVGSSVDSKASEATGQEITLSFANGNMYSVVQEVDPKFGMFKVGDKVRVVNNGQFLRVTY